MANYSGKFEEERKEVARFLRRLYRQKLTTTLGGNISVRITEDLVAITSSGSDKGRMKWKDIAVINIMGENLTPEIKPSIESGMHIAIYKRRPDIKAIVHAHPVFASSFTAMKLDIETNLTAEACAILASPVVVPYALMGTPELAASVADYAEKSDILLLENHGTITMGENILKAFDKTEVLENAAQMTLIVNLCQNKRPLTKSQVLEIKSLFG